MTKALTLNIANPFPSASEMLNGIASFAKVANCIFDGAVAEVDSCVRGVMSKVEEFPKEAKALYGRASTTVNDILSEIRAGIEKMETATGISQKFSQVAEKANKIFEKVVHRVEALETHAELVMTGFEMGTLVHRIEEISHSAAKGMGAVVQPIQLIILVDEVKKVAHHVLSAVQDGVETVKAKEMAVLGFSIMSKLCNLLSFLQKLGLFSHATAHATAHGIAHVSRVTLIGSFSYLMMTLVQLGNELRNYSSVPKLVKAFLNITIALLGLALVFYVSTKAHVLLLILTASTLLLSLLTKDHEEAHTHELQEIKHTEAHAV